MSTSTSPILSIPSEMLSRVFDFLDIPDYVTARLVNWHFKKQAEQTISSIKDLSFDIHDVTASDLRAVGKVSNWSKLRTLTVSFSPGSDDVVPVMQCFRGANIDTVHVHAVRGKALTSLNPVYLFEHIRCASLVLNGFDGSGVSLTTFGQRSTDPPSARTVTQIIDGETTSTCLYDYFTCSGGPALGLVLLAEDTLLTGADSSERDRSLLRKVQRLMSKIEVDSTGQILTVACQSPATREECDALRDRLRVDGDKVNFRTLDDNDASYLGEALRSYKRLVANDNESAIM